MLCDIRMPGTSGVALVPQAIEIEPELAILMLTAVNDATSAPLHAQRGAGGVVHGGEHEDREFGLDLDSLRYEVDAAGAGHPDVAQHERDAVAPELLQGFLTRARGIHFVLLLREELLEGVPDGFLIVHD